MYDETKNSKSGIYDYAMYRAIEIVEGSGVE